jgi:hypothetical protein
MKNAKTLLAIVPLVAIAAIAIGVGMSSNVLAQPTTSHASAAVDPQDSPNASDQKDTPIAVNGANNGADNQKDGETSDQISAKEGPNGDGDGEQKDPTELKK